MNTFKACFLIVCCVFFRQTLSSNSWPTQNWDTQTLLEANINVDRFEELKKYVFRKDLGFKTDGLVIIKNSKIIFEKYDNGYDLSKRHLLWSASKSFTGALVGVAIKKGQLDLSTSVKSFFPKLKPLKGTDITIKHLLQMSSGINWNEGYEGSPLKSNVIKMLYTSGYKDMADYTSSVEVKFLPEQNFRYSSGETNLLMGVLRKGIGVESFVDYPWDELFNPLNIKSAVWERDHKKNFVGSSYLYMTPRDAARFGLLF